MLTYISKSKPVSYKLLTTSFVRLNRVFWVGCLEWILQGNQMKYAGSECLADEDFVLETKLFPKKCIFLNKS